MIENKNLLLSSAEKSVNAIFKAGAENADTEDVYFVVGTAIHWMSDCIDRIPIAQIKEEHKQLFSALRFANNCLKHNITFENAHKVKRFGYPYDYAYDYGTHYNWISLDQVKISEKSENQRKNYKSELEGKNIAITLLEILNIVKEYYDMV